MSKYLDDAVLRLGIHHHFPSREFGGKVVREKNERKKPRKPAVLLIDENSRTVRAYKFFGKSGCHFRIVGKLPSVRAFGNGLTAHCNNLRNIFILRFANQENLPILRWLDGTAPIPSPH